MTTIHLATTVDTNFVQHLGVTLCSLFENNKTNHFIIYIIIDFEENDDFIKLKKLIAQYGHTLETIVTDGKEVDKLKIADHFSRAIYYRLSLPDIIDKQIPKILYLDSDTVVRKPIDELWNTDLSEYAVGAVQEALFRRYTQLNLPEKAIYFNSGVLLINLDYWRKNNVKQKAIDFIRENAHNIAYPDQDGLNVVLQGKWLELPPVWNQQTLFFDDKNAAHKIRKDWLEEAKKNPSIIHYTGRLKPWHYYCEHPYAQEYYHYRALTDWKNSKLPQKKVQNILKQNMKRMLNLLYGKEKYKIYKRSMIS